MISIILSTHNGAKYIDKAIQSVLDQTFTDWEFIIIDDGSTDNTFDIVSRYVEKESRIILIRNEKNLDVIKSLNLGIQKSSGEYIARIDDDDTWIDTNKLQEQFLFLKENPEYVMVGTSGIVVEDNGKKLVDYRHPAGDTAIRNSILIKNPFIHSAVFLRKNAVLKAGGYYRAEGEYNAEDYDLWLKMGLQGKFANIDKPMTTHMARIGNISFNNKKYIFQNNLTLIRKYKDVYPHYRLALMLTWFKYIIYSSLKVFGNMETRFKIYKFFRKQYLKLRF